MNLRVYQKNQNDSAVSWSKSITLNICRSSQTYFFRILLFTPEIPIRTMTMTIWTTRTMTFSRMLKKETTMPSTRKKKRPRGHFSASKILPTVWPIKAYYPTDPNLRLTWVTCRVRRSTNLQINLQAVKILYWEVSKLLSRPTPNELKICNRCRANLKNLVST